MTKDIEKKTGLKVSNEVVIGRKSLKDELATK